MRNLDRGDEHESITSDESGLVDDERVIVATVPDNVHGRGVVDEVLSQSLESQFIRVGSNKRLENCGGVVGLGFCKACGWLQRWAFCAVS